MLTEIKYGKHIQGEVIDFTMHECGNCGIPFFVPTKWLIAKQAENGSFKCPNGCARVFVGETAAQKLQRELDQLKIDKAREHEALQNKWLDTLSDKIKVEKKLKRIHKGVCSCCNRSFENLQQHIATQHPELIGKQKIKRVYTKRK